VEANEKTISVHLLESKEEVELYHNEGSLKQWYDKMGWECDFLHYASPAERIVASIEQNKRVVVVHGCEATATDIERINSHFITPATWVLCPESNRYISDSKPPVELLRTKGAKIAIGTDSLASARELSMVENMRLLGDVPLTELLRWATKNGAEAMGLDAKLGTIEVGKTPGIVLLENCDLHNLRLTPESRTRRIL
jgi:cytosine/adenosine deaminase-related metal-dependent hydrolase